MKNPNPNTIIISAVLVIVAGVGGFIGGTQFQKSQTSSNIAVSRPE